MTGTSFLALCVDASLALLAVALTLAVVRLARGPSLPDRVVALDFLTTAILAFCGLAALRSGVTAMLDIALVLALVGFLATVALARFAERGVGDRTRDGGEG